MKQVLTVYLLFVVSLGAVSQEELPRADFGNTFYMLPLYERIRVPGLLSYEARETQMLKMMEQLGQGNLYHRLGFSFIYSPGADMAVREMCELARKHGTHAGLIFALQSHTRNDYRNVADKDLRLYQWRMDGEDWKGAFTTSGTLEVPEDQRDYKIPTPSRLAIPLREYNAVKAKEWAESALKLMSDYPGVVACINGPIEEELAIGGHSNTQKLADYSPYAITEFRDWLRHTGIYDDSDGRYAGEGASAHIIGELVDFNGTLRSQFYDDPTPAGSNGTGVSFNEFFDREFSTWSLKYWDLWIFTDPISDVEFDCTPESGQGHTEGGFDAPRVMNVHDRLWEAWTYDIPDQGGAYPAGNPEAPAYGFRQNLVRNFVRDLFDVLEETGLPREIMFAHQIPGEALGNFTGAGGRNRSSASTIWTGYMEKSRTVGITRFGDMDPDLATQYAGDWGIFEWHTQPNPHLSIHDLYVTSMNHLNKFYAGHCHILFPGWWREEPPASDETFPLNDSKFAEAIGDFMMARDEKPYRGWDDSMDFIPPKVNNVVAEVTDTALLLSWDDHLWPDLVSRWYEWDGMDGFEIELSRDGVGWFSPDTVQECRVSLSYFDTIYQVRVRALSAMHSPGPWSDVVSSIRDTAQLSMHIQAEYDSLYADPEFTNWIRVSFSDQELVIDPDSASMSIRGEGSNLNTSPVELDMVEMYWPMNNISDSPGQHGLDEVVVSGGIFSAIVSSEEPVDPYFYLAESSLDGGSLPHIAFRMYSSMANTGQFYWFDEGGHHSITYPIDKGWQIIRLDSLDEWISLEKITQFRIDPGTLAGVEIKVDWVAVSAEKLSGQLEGDILIGDHELSMLTSPTANSGSYTVEVEYASMRDSITVFTDTVNLYAEVALLHPGADVIIELGQRISLEALASDPDGRIDTLQLMANEGVLMHGSGNSLQMSWKTDRTGTHKVYALARDNAGQWVSSDTANIQVFIQEAYAGTPHVLPGMIEAEDFDLGGEAVAYHDSDEENLGGAYRDEGVDVAALDGESGAHYVGWIEDGEWMEYLVELSEGRKMEIAVLASMEEGMGEFHLELDDVPVSRHIFIAATGQAFDTVRFEDLFLPSGIHKLKLVADQGGFRIDKMEITEYDVFILGMDPSEQALSLYPNPANTGIRLRCELDQESRAGIWTLNGMLLKQVALAPGREHSIDVQDLPRGLYILEVETQGKIIRGKFVKQ